MEEGEDFEKTPKLTETVSILFVFVKIITHTGGGVVRNS